MNDNISKNDNIILINQDKGWGVVVLDIKTIHLEMS